MRSISKLFLIILALVIISSCSNKIYYTTSLNAKVVEKGLSVNKIQFYLSKKIVFTRELPLNNSALANGEIKFEDGRLIDQIIIKKNTPGTCEYMDNGFMFMSFEEGDNKLIRFNPDDAGKFYVLYMNQHPDNLGKIRYDTAMYTINKGSFGARLWVRKDQDYILKVTNRVATGKIVKEN